MLQCTKRNLRNLEFLSEFLSLRYMTDQRNPSQSPIYLSTHTNISRDATPIKLDCNTVLIKEVLTEQPVLVKVLRIPLAPWQIYTQAVLPRSSTKNISQALHISLAELFLFVLASQQRQALSTKTFHKEKNKKQHRVQVTVGTNTIGKRKEKQCVLAVQH